MKLKAGGYRGGQDLAREWTRLSKHLQRHLPNSGLPSKGDFRVDKLYPQTTFFFFQLI